MDNERLSRFDTRIQDLLAMAWYHRWLVVITTVLVVASAAIVTFVQTPMYTATAVVEAVPKAGQELKLTEVVTSQNAGNMYLNQQFFRTETQKLVSRSTREEVIRRYQELGFSDLEGAAGVRALKGMLIAMPKSNSRLIDISINDSDPERAAVLANLMAQTYLDRNIERRQDAAESARLWLSEQLEGHVKKIEESSRALMDFRAKNDLAYAEENLSALSAQIVQINSTYADVSTRRLMLETTIDDHARLLSRRSFEELVKVVDSVLINQLTETYANAIGEHAEVAASFGPKHHRYRESQARIDRVQEQVQTEVRRVLAAERAGLELLKSQEERLKIQIDVMNDALLTKQRLFSSHDVLESRVDEHRHFHQKLSRRYDELTLASRTQLNNVWIVDSAIAPLAPSSPRWGFNLAVALLVGLGLGAMLAIGREYLDDSIASEVDVRVFLKAPFLGVVPVVRDGLTRRDRSLFTHVQPKSAIAEAVRGIRTMIEMSLDPSEPGSILITSSVAAEGKTATTTRLAIAYAKLGRSVLVVDADLRRSQMHTVFNCPNTFGLSDVLDGRAEPLGPVVQTEVDNLWVMPAGARPEHPNELLASSRMSDAIAVWEARFDMVLIDTPPAVAVSDVLTLARSVPRVLLIVRARTHSRQMVQHTVERFRHMEANILGVVLNALEQSRFQSGYGYGYGYGYGAYGDDDVSEPVRGIEAPR